MLKIGLTGNIASGKSKAQQIISSLGFKVIDLDIVSRQLFENNIEIREKIINNFNTLDRKKIAQIIFNDTKKRKILENIIHPELNKYIEIFFKENKDEIAVFVSGATIFEAGFSDVFDKILLIDAKEELKLARLMKRNNLSKEDARLRLNSQQNNINKTKYVIYNNSTLEDLEKNIKEILKKML